jgi:iron complex outermembrane recepter protein
LLKKIKNYIFPNVTDTSQQLRRFALIVVSVLTSTIVFSQTTADVSPTTLKKLTMEELMNIEVTTVSKRPEKLTEAASAIQVITREDIIRSAATSVPEALRLCPNLQVAQVSSQHWIISARGFNSTFANKLLVMINGRTVYSPLFAGVFWDAQNVLLEDVDRIEVISGPGGTLWGANAVNGVINIITKNASETQGLYASVSAGYALRHLAEARYGGSIGSKLFYRVYGQHRERNHTTLPSGEDNRDRWRLMQAGFQVDWLPTNANDVTVRGNIYGGLQRTTPDNSNIDGQNVLARWAHRFSEKSDLTAQVYFDRTWRKDVPGSMKDELGTYDVDLQHHFMIGRSHNIVWGAGYRMMKDKTQNGTLFVGFIPKDRDMHLVSTFVQDEITVIPSTLKLTIGSKFQHNVFTGFEVQPSGRLAWMVTKHNTLWTAVSRAVRMPSRIDVDYHIPAYHVPPDQPSVDGGPNFVSEKVISYELGYRVQPSQNLSLSLAGFYSVWDDLYSVEPLPGTVTYQIQNGVEGDSRGFEFAANYQPADLWRLRGGYTYFDKQLENKPGNNTDPSALSNLGSDAPHQFSIQSILDLPANFQFDVVVRYVDDQPSTQFNPEIPSYFNLDSRIAWNFRHLEVAVAGQNLLKEFHSEYGGIQIPRNVNGRVTWRF